MARYEKPYSNGSAILEFEYIQLHFESTVENHFLKSTTYGLGCQMLRLPLTFLTLRFNSPVLLGHLKFLPPSVLL